MVKLRKQADGQFPPLLHLTYNLQQLADKTLLPQVGIGLGQSRILSGLHPSVPMSQKELAFGLHQTEANISRQLQVLKKQGLVSIVRNKKDSRQRDVKLTAKGVKRYELAVKLLDVQQKEMLKLLGNKDRSSFNKGIEGLIILLSVNTASRRNLGK